MVRRGFSLVELVVVLAIIGLLAGLTLAAVQQVRSSAARLTCENKLKQVGLALHNYAQAHGSLPPGVSHRDGKDPFPFMGWHTRLLPYVEQTPRWEEAVAAFRSEKDFLKDPPHIGLSTAIPIYGCPVDARTRVAQPTSGGGLRGLTSYMGVNGTSAFRQDGCLFLDSAVRLADVTDGTSNTILVGERPPSADMVLGWWYAGWGQDKDGEADMLLGVRTVNNRRYAPSCEVGPHHFTAGRISNQCDAFHFWSLHPGGANFAFCDGSVRFLRYSADAVLPALATRAGGEVVPGDY
jgi:prepilin-type N-terminal cleavage/methylation domain-containing protein/prepilin-type processing-associated H-X9-DG protein